MAGGSFHIVNAEHNFLFVSVHTEAGAHHAQARPAMQPGDVEEDKFLWEKRPLPDFAESLVYCYLWNKKFGYLYESKDAHGADFFVRTASEVDAKDHDRFKWSIVRNGLWSTIRNKKTGHALFASGSTRASSSDIPDHVVECGPASAHCKYWWFVLDQVSLHRWMTDLGYADGTSIAWFSIPGTHDSATSVVSKGTARCQELTIADQLRQGTRFIDCRAQCITLTHDPITGNPIYLDPPFLGLYHGPVALGEVKDLVDALTEFLTQNPGEFILLLVNNEEGTDAHELLFARMVQHEYERNRTMWFVENRIPTYREAKGKIVLLRRYQLKPEEWGLLPLGIEARPWHGTDLAHHPIALIENGEGKPRLSRQDYSSLNGAEYDKKWEFVEQQLNAAKAQLGEVRNPADDILYLNFTSGECFPSVTPYDVATAINPRTEDYLRQDQSGRYGCVVVDYARANLNAAILASNGGFRR